MTVTELSSALSVKDAIEQRRAARSFQPDPTIRWAV